MKIMKFDIIDSTNDYLMKNHKGLDHWQLVTACHQTHGKGRQRKHWSDSTGSALFSILLREGLSFPIVAQIPLIAAVSVHKVLSGHLSELKIKWPNDLLISNLKVAGILTQSIIEGNVVKAVVVGFGININNQTFENEIKKTATSVFLNAKIELDIDRVITSITTIFQAEFLSLAKNSLTYLTYYNKHSALLGKKISYLLDNKKQNGVAQQVLATGQLRVTTKTTELSLCSGEVQLLK